MLSFKYKYATTMSGRYTTWVRCSINWHNDGYFNINYKSPITGLVYRNQLVPEEDVEWVYDY